MSMTFNIPPPPPKQQGTMPPPPPPKRQTQAQPNQWEKPYETSVNNPAFGIGASQVTGLPPDFITSVLKPFAGIMDRIYSPVYQGGQGLQKVWQGIKSGDIPQVLAGASQTGVNALMGTMPATNIGASIIGQGIRTIAGQKGEETVGKVFTPTQTIGSAVHQYLGLPESAGAKNVEATADNVVQGLLLKGDVPRTTAQATSDYLGRQYTEKVTKIGRESQNELKVREDIRQAVAPKVPREQFNHMWQESAPYLKQEQIKSPIEATKDVNAVTSAVHASNNAIRVFDYNNIRPSIERVGQLNVDQATVSGELKNTLAEYEPQVTPEILTRMQKMAQFYDKPQTIKDAYENTKTLNADKQIKTYFGVDDIKKHKCFKPIQY